MGIKRKPFSGQLMSSKTNITYGDIAGFINMHRIKTLPRDDKKVNSNLEKSSESGNIPTLQSEASQIRFPKNPDAAENTAENRENHSSKMDGFSAATSGVSETIVSSGT